MSFLRTVWNAGWNTHIEIGSAAERAALLALLRRLRLARPRPAVSTVSAYLDALTVAFGPALAELDAPAESQATLVLDGSAIISLARGNPRVRALVARGVAEGARIVVPATALLDPQVATISGFVADVVDIDARIVRRAAAIMAAARLNRPLEALAVGCAAVATPPATLVTVNGSTLGALVKAAGQPGLAVFVV